MTFDATLRRIGGAVIDGAVRDVAEIRASGLPMFCRSVVPRGPHSGFGGTVDGVVSVAGVSISPGDIVLGNDDGVAVVPLRYAAEVFAEATAHLDKEEHGWTACGPGKASRRCSPIRSLSWCADPILRSAAEDGAAGVAGGGAEFGLDADQLVVFRRPVAAREAAGLDLPAIGGDGEVGDGRVLGLARAVAHDRAPAGVVGDFDRFQRLGQRADLVDLDQDRVGGVLGDAARRRSGLVTKMSSPTNWILLPSVSVRSFQPSQSSSAQPSSMETIG